MSAAEFNLGRHCGITFARIKPASLFTVREEDIKILAYFAAKFRTKGFVFVVCGIWAAGHYFMCTISARLKSCCAAR